VDFERIKTNYSEFVDKKTEWDLVIRPKSGLFDLHLDDIWRYRDLLVLFVKRDIVAQYKQTILGPLWHVVQPVLTTLVFLLVFGRIARVPTDGSPPFLFYLSGITMWIYFASCLSSTSNTFITNAYIFGKVYFPRLIIPMSIVLSNLVRLAIQLGLLTVAIIWYNFKGFIFHFNWWLCLIPFLVLILAGLGLGLGIIISSLTTKYRDLSILMTFVVQLWMYISPVGYSLSYIKNSKYESIINLNPLSSILEGFRFALFQKGNFEWKDLLYSISFMLISLFVGLIIFNRVEKSFMDTV
jgi:lipopolysaccharide transport system permease protein